MKYRFQLIFHHLSVYFYKALKLSEQHRNQIKIEYELKNILIIDFMISILWILILNIQRDELILTTVVVYVDGDSAFS